MYGVGRTLQIFTYRHLNSFFRIFFILEAAKSATDQPTGGGGAMETKLAGFLKVQCM